MQTIYTKYLASRQQRIRQKFPGTCVFLDRIYARAVALGIIIVSFDTPEGD